MGIFTTGAVDSNIDIYSPVQEDFDVTGRYVNFHEAAIRATVDSERMYNNVMKSVGIAELHYFEAHGSEVVYEAADIGAFFDKIKAVFRKLIDKVKAIFHAFMAKLSTFTTKDKEFAKKYDKEFIEKWNKVSESADLIKGYNYTHLNTLASDTKWCEFNVAAWRKITANGDSNDHWHLDNTLNKFHFGVVYNATDNKYLHPDKDGTGELYKDIDKELYSPGVLSKLPSLKDDCKYIKEHREDMQEAIRGKIVAHLFGSNEQKMDDKDFADALFEGFRDGESDKENLSKSDLKVSAVDIISELKEAKKTKESAEKATRLLVKAIDQNIKDLESMQKDCRNNLAKERKENSAMQADVLSYLTEITSLYRNHKEYAIQAKGAFLQALTERSRQYKAIVAKVIAGSKKITEESYDYGSGGSFLDSVTIV